MNRYPLLPLFCLMTASMTLALAGAATAADPPPAPSRAEVEAVLAQAPAAPATDTLRPLHIVLVADQKDHGPNEHDYPLWQSRWKALLGGNRDHAASQPQVNLYGPPTADARKTWTGAPKVKVTTAWQWPSPEQFRSAHAIVMFCYRSGGAPRVWSDERLADLDAYLARGGGFVPIHSPTYMPGDLKRPEAKWVVGLTGLVFDQSIQVRHGPMTVQIAARQHPICRGLPDAIAWIDEPYWPPVGDLGAVEVLAASKEKAKDASQAGPQPMFWAYRRGKGRVFGCVPGHYTWTFDDPYFRILLLRGIAWASGESPYRFDGLVLYGARVREGDKK